MVVEVARLQGVEGDAECPGKGAGIALSRGGGTALPGGHGARRDAHSPGDFLLGETSLPAKLGEPAHAGEDIRARERGTVYMGPGGRMTSADSVM